MRLTTPSMAIAASELTSCATYDDLRRPATLRTRARRPARRRLRGAEPDPGAGDPGAADRSGRDRPGPDRDGQDRRVRAADARVRRPGRSRDAGTRAHADARAVHPGDAGAADLRPPQADRPRR